MPVSIPNIPQRPKGTSAKQLARDLCTVVESVRESRGVMSVDELNDAFISIALLLGLRLAESRQ